MGDKRDVSGYRTCKQCGKVFYVISPDDYVFKRVIKHKDGKADSIFFCKYSCKRAFDLEREERKKQKRDTEIKQSGKRRCLDCKYCMSMKYGFKDCSIYGMPIRVGKCACRRFRERDTERI